MRVLCSTGRYEIFTKVGEFKVNVTRRVDEFISNHKEVIQNIKEIRKLRSEISAQNTEMKEVINDYKTFNREEGEKEIERDDLSLFKVDLVSQKNNMTEIENEIALLKSKTNRKQNENTKMRGDITKMER